MASFPIGLVLVLAVFYFSGSKDAWSLYVNQHAMLLVIGGSAAVLLMSTPFSILKKCGANVLGLFRRMETFEDYLGEVSQLTKSRGAVKKSINPLIAYAVQLWQQGIDAELFIVLLAQRREEIEREDLEVVQSLRNLGKYPPALGMTGTVMGLISLFAVLGNDKAQLGPALALAMTATFFGLILTNAIINPLCDHLHLRHLQKEKLYTGLYQVLTLLNRGEPSAIVEEEANHRAAA